MTSKEKIRRAVEKYPEYLRSNYYHLSDVYSRFSDAKRSAWKYCEDLRRRYGGEALKVISYNTSFFTAGFTFKDNAGADRFMYITANYDIDVPII